MRVRIDPDQAAKGGPGAIIQRVFVKQIAGRAGRDVVLQRPGVKLLLVLRDRDGEQIAASAFANQAAQTFETRIARTEMQIQAHGRAVMIDRGRVHLQRAYILAPVLGTDVSDLCRSEEHTSELQY